MAGIAVGIDLGTSNSCVAVARGKRVDVLANAYGETVTPSVVAFKEDGSIVVGQPARTRLVHDPYHTISSSKRLIGRYYFSEEVKKAQAVCAYHIVEGPSHSIRIQVREEQFALPEISAMVLREMKRVAEKQLGEEVTEAVIAVPAYFNDNQRQATRDAGRIAGLDVLRLLNEPTAAALAYGFGRGLTQRVAVYDLGGGTFDVSVLEIGTDVFEVLSTCGDTYLGGDDFDDRIIDLLADAFQERHGINLRRDVYALEKLKVAAEVAKKGLSMDDEVEIRIPDIAQTEDGQSLAIEHRLDTAEFSSLVMDLVQRTFKVCDEALQQADVIARDLDGVILVGGPTRLPLIRQAVSDYFQQEPKADVDPDEVVAMGAAIHAAALSGDSPQDAFLLDVTPLSLRIGVAGGLAEPVIERNTPVPIEQTRGFTTFKDGQESVQIRVYQGESRQADENEMLGQFEFSGFRKARRGEARIEVTFEIDTNGIVNVTARDPETGKATSAEISLSSGLSETEIDQILETANTDRVTGERGPELETDEDDLAATDDDDLAMVSNEPPEPAVVLKPAPVAEAAPMEARAASPAERVIEPDEDDEMDITLDPTPPEMREVAAPAMGRVLEPELDASDPELEVDVEIEPSPTVSSATRDDAVDPLASTSGELEIDPATLAAGMDEPLPDEPAGAQGSDPAPEPGAAQTVEEALPDIELGDDDLAMLGSDGEVQDDAPLFGNVGTDLSDYHDDKDER